MAEFDAFALIVSKFGEPEHAAKAEPQTVAQYRQRLPPALLRFWQEHGQGSFRQGRLWLADPAALQPAVNAMFKGDEEFKPSDLTAFAYSAFGTLYCWHPTELQVTVDPIQAQVTNPGDPDAYQLVQATVSDDFAVGMNIEGAIENDDLSVFDEQDNDLFPSAIARLGPLAPGEIYGFVPAIGFGGHTNLEGLRHVPVLEHLLFLTQLGPLTLQRLTPPSPGSPFGELVSVRHIGPPGTP